MSIGNKEPESGARGESRLRRRIADEIRRLGPMPFSRYMQMCLYEPELGYYSRAREQFGKAGDFYTSSDVHAVFGRLLARQFEEMWRALDSPPRIDIIELGPGRGLFARDVLDWSAKQFPEFSCALHYALVEQSPHLRERLQERLAEHIAAERARVFDSLEAAAKAAGENIIVFGNEFLDALPVEVVDYRGALRIGEENGKFVETFDLPTGAEAEFLDRYSVRPEKGERVEATLIALRMMEGLAEVFQGRRGFLVLIDYGYTREEQLAGRHRDTIMSYRQHTVSASPYEAPGEQDITAHVNFTAIRERGFQRGLEPVALLTQSQFLIGIGEETQFARCISGVQTPARARQGGIAIEALDFTHRHG